MDAWCSELLWRGMGSASLGAGVPVGGRPGDGAGSDALFAPGAPGRVGPATVRLWAWSYIGLRVPARRYGESAASQRVPEAGSSGALATGNQGRLARKITWLRTVSASERAVHARGWADGTGRSLRAAAARQYDLASEKPAARVDSRLGFGACFQVSRLIGTALLPRRPRDTRGAEPRGWPAAGRGTRWAGRVWAPPHRRPGRSSRWRWNSNAGRTATW